MESGSTNGVLKPRNIIVMGASAGGIPAIKRAISGLPNSIDAAVLVVLHVSRKSNPTNIVSSFQRATSLNCTVASNGMVIKKGTLYLAPPDHHLITDANEILIVNQGAHENKYRPSIDVLFRSAAVNFGNRAVSVILSGLLEDGTSGTSAIKRCGGICIVQEPSEADYSDMPQSVLNKVAVDFVVSVDQVSETINEIVNAPLPPRIPIPQELRIEAEISKKMTSDIQTLKKIADHSDFVCPECGGGLWAIKNDPTHRYRCHTGHVYNETLLHELQEQKIEESIYVSLRMLEEKQNLLMLMAKRKEDNNGNSMSDLYQKRVQDVGKHIENLKMFLAKFNEDMINP